LKTILTAILGFEFDWMLCADSSKDPEMVGSFDNSKNYRLSVKEIQHLHKEHLSLSQNRQDHIMRMRALKKAQRRNEQPEVFGKPSLNKKSMELTKEISAGMDYADYLL
jgi:hypothetical protein